MTRVRYIADSMAEAVAAAQQASAKRIGDLVEVRAVAGIDQVVHGEEGYVLIDSKA